MYLHISYPSLGVTEFDRAAGGGCNYLVGGLDYVSVTGGAGSVCSMKRNIHAKK